MKEKLGSLEAHLENVRKEVFEDLVKRIQGGTFYPPRNGSPGEWVVIINEWGHFGVISTTAEEIESPQLIHAEWIRSDLKIDRIKGSEFWFAPGKFEVQHYDYRENPENVEGDRVYTPIDERTTMEPEELIFIAKSLRITLALPQTSQV